MTLWTHREQRGVVQVDRVDLHIGVEKTGTSTIQAALHKARDRLAAQLVLYPTVLGTGNHMALAVIGRGDNVVDDLRQRRGLMSPDAVRAFRRRKSDELRAQVSAVQARRVVLSNEHCSSRLGSEEDIERLVTWLRQTVDGPLHVHIYLRRQDHMLESRYSTAVRYGAANNLELPDEREFRALYDFEGLLDRWARVVGDGHVHPRIFDRGVLAGGDVVLDFTGALGLPRLTSKESGEVNIALDAPTQRFAALLNRHVPRFTGTAHNPLHDRVLTALDDVESSGEPMRLTPPAAAEFLARARSGNDEVARRWFSGPPLFNEARVDGVASRELDVVEAVRLAAHVVEHVASQLRHEHRAANEAWREQEATLRAQLDAAEQTRDRLAARLDEVWSMRSHLVGRALARPVWRLRRWLRRLRTEG